MEELTGIGVGGIFAVLVIREVFTFVKGRQHNHGPMNGSLGRIEAKVDTIMSKTAQLHQWHAVTDQDGVPVWYVRRSMERAVDRMAEATDRMVTLLERMAAMQEDTHEKLKEL